VPRLSLEAFRNDNSKCNYIYMVLLNELSMIDDSTMDCELLSTEKRQKLAIVLSYPAESSFSVSCQKRQDIEES